MKRFWVVYERAVYHTYRLSQGETEAEAIAYAGQTFIDVKQEALSTHACLIDLPPELPLTAPNAPDA